MDAERLRLERLCHKNVDLFDFYSICSGSESGDSGGSDSEIEAITRYMPWSPHETVAESKAFIDHAEKRWDDGDRAKYVDRPGKGETGAGEFAGLIGLHVDWEHRTGTIWMWLREPFWGRGYAGERALASMELAFSHLDLDLAAVTHAVENERSERAVEKYVTAAGSGRDGVLRNRVPHGDGHVYDEVRYTVTRDSGDRGPRTTGSDAEREPEVFEGGARVW